MSIEHFMDLQYKMKHMEMKIKKYSTLLDNNNSVILNTQYHSSSMKKKRKSFLFHKSIEDVAFGYVSNGHIYGNQNPENIVTKYLGSMDILSLTVPFI